MFFLVVFLFFINLNVTFVFLFAKNIDALYKLQSDWH